MRRDLEVATSLGRVFSGAGPPRSLVGFREESNGEAATRAVVVAADSPPMKKPRKASIQGLVKSQPMAKKLKMLRQREMERQMRITVEVDTWFDEVRCSSLWTT